MDTKLAAINPYLAWAVLTVAAAFAVSVTLLATVTGQPLLFVGTALGVTAGGYAMQIARRPSVKLSEVPKGRQPVAA